MRSLVRWVKQGYDEKSALFIVVFLVCVGLLLVSLISTVGKAKDAHPDGRIASLLASLASTNSPNYASAVDSVQRPDAQTLQLIIAEIKYIGGLEKKGDYVDAGNRTFDLCAAFKIAGTNLTPMLPDVRAEFLSGDSIGASGWALVSIGGEAWRTLLQGLTNSNPRVQLCAVEAMQYANVENSILALPFLEKFLTNSSDILKIQSVDTIGHIAVDSRVKAELLVHTINSETNVLVISMAVKALGRAGDQGDYVQGFLRQIGTNQNEHIHTAVATALQELKEGR